VDRVVLADRAAGVLSRGGVVPAWRGGPDGGGTTGRRDG